MIKFKDKSEIKDLVKRADNHTETQRLTTMFQQRKEERKEFYLEENELEEILRWKLRSRYKWLKEQRKANSQDKIKAITKIAFNFSHSNDDIETELKLTILSTLVGVGIPVASAILTLCYPQKYAVIDIRNWRQVYPDNPKTTYTTADYIKYLKDIQEQARKYGVTPQEFDIAIWKKDIIESKKKILTFNSNHHSILSLQIF